LPRLSSVGFDLTNLGQGSYAINGIPAGIEGLNYVRLLQDMVEEALQHDNASSDELERTLALSMARHAAIPQGQVLNNDEMENIVNELFACGNVNYTPDGHTILCILPQHEIEELLK
jgi:DNA mismatch repair protein MutL